MRRACVYQERLLSPQVPPLAVYELSFECRQRSACDCTGITTGVPSKDKLCLFVRFISHIEPHQRRPRTPSCRLAPAPAAELGQHPPTIWGRHYVRVHEVETHILLIFLSFQRSAVLHGSVIPTMRTDQYLAGLVCCRSRWCDICYGQLSALDRSNV